MRNPKVKKNVNNTLSVPATQLHGNLDDLMIKKEEKNIKVNRKKRICIDHVVPKIR